MLNLSVAWAKKFEKWAVVVAQLVERSLQNSRGPRFESSHRHLLSTVLNIRK